MVFVSFFFRVGCRDRFVIIAVDPLSLLEKYGRMDERERERERERRERERERERE